MILYFLTIAIVNKKPILHPLELFDDAYVIRASPISLVYYSQAMWDYINKWGIQQLVFS
jgi:hypothetical protein